MDQITILWILAIVFGFYMAWNIGANDVANAMGTSVGAKSLTLKQAVIIAAILEFAGAFLVGSHVSETVRKGIIDPAMFADEPMMLVYGMLAALLAAAVWLQIATSRGWPVSTTHSIVGAIIGFGIIYGGLKAVDWTVAGSIAVSWLVSPFLSMAISFCMFSLLRRRIFHAKRPVAAAKQLTPYLVFFVFLILTLVMVFKGLKNLHLDLPLLPALGIAIVVGLIAAGISAILVRRISDDDPNPEHESFSPETQQMQKGLRKALKHLKRVAAASGKDNQSEISRVLTDVEKLEHELRQEEADRPPQDFSRVEKIFVYLQILSASFIAFAHGANDVANSIGPLSTVVDVLRSGKVALQAQVHPLVLMLGGVGIVIGLATWGWRVIETIGKKITELTPSRGFAADIGAATTIVLASRLGLPISTTHALVGAVLGVGLARGMGAIDLRVIRNIVISWLVTVPAGAILAIIFFCILRAIFG